MGIFWNFVTLLWPWPLSNVYQKLMVTIPPRGATFCKFSGSLDQNCGQDRVQKNRRHNIMFLDPPYYNNVANVNFFQYLVNKQMTNRNKVKVKSILMSISQTENHTSSKIWKI